MASSALTLFIPNITTVFSVVGGVGCVAISYIIPLLSYLAVFKEEKVKGYAFILIGSVLSAIGIGSAVNGIIRKG